VLLWAGWLVQDKDMDVLNLAFCGKKSREISRPHPHNLKQTRKGKALTTRQRVKMQGKEK
jgi:hypothetical protein